MIHFFVIARKKPLIFLHWYHNVTVLLYCWHSYATLAPQELYFVVMNYTVHTAMYGYYRLMALGIYYIYADISNVSWNVNTIISIL